MREFRASYGHDRRCCGRSPGSRRACRRRPERQGRGAPGRPALARPLRRRGRRRLGADDARRTPALPAEERHQGDGKGRHGDALQAGQARHAAPRPARPLARAGRLGRRIARVQPEALRPACQEDRRSLRRRDCSSPAALPALPWAHARRRRRCPDVSGSRAREGEDRGCACAAGTRARRKAGRGLRRDRTSLPDPACGARAREPPDAGERAHARPAAACPRPHRRRSSCRAVASVREHRPRPHRAAGRGLLRDRAPVRRACHTGSRAPTGSG